MAFQYERPETSKSLNPSAGGTAELQGEVLNTRLINESSGWGFGALLTKKGRVNFTGIVEDLYEGADIELLGTWTEHPSFGWQVKAERFTVRMPSTGAGVAAWLCHRMSDVGPVRANRLVAMIPPPELWDVLVEGDIERLTTVPGIGEQIAQQICSAYVTWKHERVQFAALAQFGLRPEQIRDAALRWGAEAAVKIEADPYVLQQLPRISFKQADAIARKMDVKRLDVRRVCAGLKEAAHVQERSGHTGQTQRKLVSIAASADVLNVRSKNVAPHFEEALDRGHLTEQHGLFFRPVTANAENSIAEAIAGLLDAERFGQ